ncbi:regulator of chromosome condensation isoform X2 [Agrilus planipennis]|uniref:Regulator of chromosome condensation isoform X1 n=1 Tax=Agrilus planipennis TaxID=224129 RepID=A0A1W4XHP3_AGRPL|nr:regulator of chromosome condensation isoform X1 [Agrilus planipennis]XP_025833056.1 regulator of chromosome condensation isoform X2 [Agrilus planipennis]
MPKRRRSSTASISSKRPKFIDHVSLPSLTKVGKVLATGAGDFGQLGLGSDILEKSRPAVVPITHEIVDICAGGMHTVCLTKDGKVLTFGCNDEGALGRETADKEDAEFIPGEVNLPDRVKQVSAGDSHTVALLEDGRVFAWGTFRDSHGNMGLTLKGNEKLPYEILPHHIVIKIASGADHIVFLTQFGEVYTCGCPEQGQLGRTSERGSDRNCRTGFSKFLQPAIINVKPSLKLKFDNIWAGTYSTFAKVEQKNDIYVFGLNNYNQIGLKSQNAVFSPKLSKEFSKFKWNIICCAQHHTIALDEDGKTYAIGRKEYGRLGLGKDCDDATELTEIPFLKNKKVVNIACGSATSFAVLDVGELYGWGMGTVGQLGTGEEEDCYEPTLIKSKQLAGKHVFRVSSGGQHTIILASEANGNNNQPQPENEQLQDGDEGDSVSAGA